MKHSTRQDITPPQMRQRAWRSLESASLITEAGDPDSGSYLAGFAAELALKARACKLVGLSALPNDKKVLGNAGLDGHSLEKLLKVAGSIKVLHEAFDNIDWPSVHGWHNEDRYRALGRVTKEQSSWRIRQTGLLVQALENHEIVDGLGEIKSELAAQGIVFNLFAWMQVEEPVWKLYLVSPWFDELSTRVERLNRVHALAQQHLAPDLVQQFEVGGAVCEGLSDQMLEVFYRVFALSAKGRPVMAIGGLNSPAGSVKRAFILAVERPDALPRPRA